MTKPPRPIRFLTLVLAVATPVGCSWISGSGDEDVPEMHRNLSRTVDIPTGVVQGDLDRAQGAATWLLGREEQRTFPSELEVHQERMLDYASQIAQARDLEAVAAQAGLLAATCGSCHQASNGGPRFVVGSGSPGGQSQEAQMIRHLWAADRMWEGLVGPSDEAWRAGAEAMAETKPALAQFLRSSGSSGQAEGLFEELNRIANKALEAEGLDEKAQVYGEMLGTCRRCHAPGTPPYSN